MCYVVNMSNLATIDKEEIRLASHLSEWSERFDREKERLLPFLTRYRPQIEHIGSTAVPGLSAKPIVDIAVKLENVDSVSDLVAPLSTLEYYCLGELVSPRCHTFCRGAPREYNLHFVDDTTEHWRRWIRFRDILRNDPSVRKEYAELKSGLASEHRFQRRMYTAGKTDFINGVLGLG